MPRRPSSPDPATAGPFTGIDPTKRASLYQRIGHCSVGKTPSGYFKVRADLPPLELIKLVGYDPRILNKIAVTVPGNISPDLEQLLFEVQRTVDQERVDEMVAYLYNALATNRFADWSEIDLVTVTEPDTSHWGEDGYVLFPQAAEYFITDGQHRFCAIMDFARRYPERSGEFTVAVAIGVLPKAHMVEWAGQSFHDKNYLQKTVKVTKALAVDARDLHNKLSKEVRRNQVIKAAGGVDVKKDSLAAKAPEFTTHAVLYKFVRGFCEGPRGISKSPIKGPNLTESTYGEFRSRLNEYLSYLGTAFPSWTVVPGRERYLFRASAAVQALGLLGFYLYEAALGDKARADMIARVGEKKLDWRRSNIKVWGSVLGRVVEKSAGGGKVVTPSSSRQSVLATARLLRQRSGVERYGMDAER